MLAVSLPSARAFHIPRATGLVRLSGRGRWAWTIENVLPTLKGPGRCEPVFPGVLVGKWTEAIGHRPTDAEQAQGLGVAVTYPSRGEVAWEQRPEGWGTGRRPDRHDRNPKPPPHLHPSLSRRDGGGGRAHPSRGNRRRAWVRTLSVLATKLLRTLTQKASPARSFVLQWHVLEHRHYRPRKMTGRRRHLRSVQTGGRPIEVQMVLHCYFGR